MWYDVFIWDLFQGLKVLDFIVDTVKDRATARFLKCQLGLYEVHCFGSNSRITGNKYSPWNWMSYSRQCRMFCWIYYTNCNCINNSWSSQLRPDLPPHFPSINDLTEILPHFTPWWLPGLWSNFHLRCQKWLCKASVNAIVRWYMNCLWLLTGRQAAIGIPRVTL